jgi:hypothetical protein
LRFRANNLISLLTTAPPQPVPSYLAVDNLAVSLASALDALVQTSPTSSPAGPQLLQFIAQQANQAFTGESQRYLLGRTVPVAVALDNRDAANWMKRIGETDPDCKSWDSIVTETAELINKPQQAELLNAIISACNPKTGAEDKQRMLRRVAVGALRSCEFAGPLMKEVSTHRAGKDAPVPPRFIECLVRERKDDANSLAIEARRQLARTSKTAEIRQIWQMSQALKAGGLTAEATQWAETAIRFATEPDKQEEKERDTLQQFNNDVLKLEILAAIDVARHAAFLAQLAKNANEFKGDPSSKFSESWAALRHFYAAHAERKPGTSCTLSSTDLSTVRAAIKTAGYYSDKNPSATATVLLPLVDRCKIEMHDGLLADIVKIVSGNSVSADRARYIAMTAPFQSNLRRAMATAETAALPSDILRGYAAAIDRHRPSTHKQTEFEYNPIRYNPISASAW